MSVLIGIPIVAGLAYATGMLASLLFRFADDIDTDIFGVLKSDDNVGRKKSLHDLMG